MTTTTFGSNMFPSLYSVKRPRSISRKYERDDRGNGKNSNCYYADNHDDDGDGDDDDDDSSSFSETLSDESGRFDDADESASTYSAKRRRSNDWPFSGPNTQFSSKNNPLGYQHEQVSTGNGDNGRTSISNSQAARMILGRRNTSIDGQPRQSKFTEGTMGDSVSEEPPSIYIGDSTRAATKKKSSSGIFRFGKTIAAAVFNPFAVSWKLSSSSVDTVEENSRDNTVARAEKAYEELKLAGYRGTAKGHYVQQQTYNGADHSIADHIREVIQEKTEHRYPSRPTTSRQHLRQYSSGSSQVSTTSSRRESLLMQLPTSLQDLRRAKTPDVQNNALNQGTECLEVKKKKSRKELQRQAKLMKRVSSLEEKLERAKRELREFTGVDEEQDNGPKLPIIDDSRPYPKRFVPGMLPTLPSERLLDRSDASASPETGSAPFEPLSPDISRIAENREETCGDHAAKSQHFSSPLGPPKVKHQDQTLMAAGTAQRKRKSPSPAPKTGLSSTANTTSVKDKPSRSITSSRTPSTSRRSKHLKTGDGESPTSAEARQSSPSPSSLSRQSRNKSIRYRKPTPPFPVLKRTTRSTAAPTPRPRTKMARSELRSVAEGNPAPLEAAKPSSTNANTNVAKGSAVNNDNDNDNSGEYKLERIQKQLSHSENYRVGSNTPPIPPLPENIITAAVAAKVDRRSLKVSESSLGTVRYAKGAEEFKWPDEIF